MTCKNLFFQAQFMYINNFHFSVEVGNWSSDIIRSMQEMFRNGTLKGLYGKEAVDKIARHMKDYMWDIIPGIILA